jgi:hypothetical protein
VQASTRLDRAGATLSVICAIHCAATPLILVLLPGAAKHSEAAETWIVAAALLIGLGAIRASRRHNGALLPRLGIGAGLAAIIGSRLLLHGPAETVLVFSGAAILVTAHLFNCRECRYGCGHPASECSGGRARLLLFLFAGCLGATSASAASLQPALLPDTVVAAAGTFAGWPYRLGGNSARGLDCSALVQRAFRAAGLELPRTAAEQFRRGYSVVRQEIRAGDLVFFRGARRLSKRIAHVGIYIGGGHFIHASRHGVVTASLNTPLWMKRFAGARRLLEAAPTPLLEGPLCVEGGGSP